MKKDNKIQKLETAICDKFPNVNICEVRDNKFGLRIRASFHQEMSLTMTTLSSGQRMEEPLNVELVPEISERSLGTVRRKDPHT